MYGLVIAHTVEKVINRLDAITAKRVNDAILKLADDPRPEGCRKVVSFKGVAYRVRAGDYRVIYEVDDKQKTVEILGVLPRPKA